MFSKSSFSKIEILPRSIYNRVPLTLIIILYSFSIVFASGKTILDPVTLIANMERVYAAVYDYQAKIEVRTYRGDTSFDVERFLYRFKKPYLLRIDVESPRAGATLIYPDKKGKAVIRLPGFARFFPLHLDPDNYLLKKGSSGQPIDKTNLGLLIENIGHSLADQLYQAPNVKEQDGNIVIQVIAQNHFREGVITNYRFFIDRGSWLPIRVEESNPNGRLERSITFNDLKVNVGLSDKIFMLDEPEGNENEQTK
jgi:outer membrane lipoprotein-sorting protein